MSQIDSPKNDTWEHWREYWCAYAEAFAQPLQSNGLVSRFVTNPNVTGSYAEAWIRSTSRILLANKFRISTGAVIAPMDKMHGLEHVPQCDLIVWDPSRLPGLFERGEFALVPLASVRAIIEVKRTMADREHLIQQLKERRDRAPMGHLLGVVVSDPNPLLNRECTPDWLAQGGSEPAITRLLDDGNKPDINGVMAFIYFLAQLAGHTETFVR
jgi:hypothetical protein